MEKIFLRFDEVDEAIINAAAQIYSAHIIAGKLDSNTKEQVIEESVDIAIRIGQLAEEKVAGFKEQEAFRV